VKAALAQVADDYDFILMDCPPTLNLLTVNAFAAAEAVLIPMQCEYYALEGLTDLWPPSRRSSSGSIPASESRACCA